MRAIVLALLLIPGIASSAEPGQAPPVVAMPAAVALSPSAEATALPTPAPPSAGSGQAPILLQVRLKDGQSAELKLLHYDSVFLSAVNAKGTKFDLPWNEVASLSSADAGPDLALMQGHLTPEASPVGSQIALRQPGTAFTQALWPGFLLHGAGHRYAGDQDTFFSLAGGELFGLVVGGFGLSELLGPEKTGESKDTALALASAGGIIFGLTWLWDLGFAPGAATKFNQAKGLALQPLPTGAQLAYRF